MSIARSALVGGPAKLGFQTKTFFSIGDIPLNVETETSDVETSMHGKVDEHRIDAICRVPVTPVGAWENLTTLFPAKFLSPAANIGARLFADADEPLAIHSNNQDLYTIIAAAITKPPEIRLGTNESLFGEMEFTGVVGTGLDMESANSLYTVQTGQAYSDATFAKDNIKRQRYTAAWANLGVPAGFDSFQAEEGWVITPEVRVEPIKVQGRTVDFKLLSAAWMAKCKPVGPTGAQLAAALRVQGSGNPQGHRLGENSNDLVITGSGVSVTLKAAQLKTAGFIFGGKPLRNGEIGFVSTIGFTAGVPAAAAVLA
jgi:hypothetical protein